MKAAIYARASTFDQEPENQLVELRRYVEPGWQSSPVFSVASHVGSLGHFGVIGRIVISKQPMPKRPGQTVIQCALEGATALWATP